MPYFLLKQLIDHFIKNVSCPKCWKALLEENVLLKWVNTSGAALVVNCAHCQEKMVFHAQVSQKIHPNNNIFNNTIIKQTPSKPKEALPVEDIATYFPSGMTIEEIMNFDNNSNDA